MTPLVKRSALSVSALALLAGAVTAFASPGYAQAPSVLQPRGGWSVTKMDQPSNGASSYCALARQYEKDIIFTLGRNMTDEYSLAVDFQKEQMDPDKAYKLTLSPGAGQVRAFDLMPLSARAMVIRLGWDDSFFKALESSRSLRVGIGDVDYSFNMPDIAAGQKDLQSCVDGLKQTAKVAQGADEDVASADPDKTDILNAEASAKAGFSARKATPEEYKRTAMSAPPPGLEKAEAVPAPSVQAVPPSAAPSVVSVDASADADMTSEMATLRAQNARLTTALEKQRAKLAQSYNDSADNNSLAEMEEKVRLLEKENKRLGGTAVPTPVKAAAKAKPNDKTPDAAAKTAEPETTAQLSDLQRQLNDLKVENNELVQKLAAAQVAKAPDSNAIMNAPAGENVQLQAAQKKLALAEEEKVRLQAELEALRRKVEDKRVSDAGGDQQLEKAVRRYNEAEREIQRLGSILEQERAVKATPGGDTARQDDRIALLEKELEKAKKAQSSISAETETALKKTQDQLAKAETDNKALLKEKSGLTTEVQQLKTALASTRQASRNDSVSDAALNSLRAEAAQKDQQLAELQNQLKAVEANASEASAQARELASLKGKIQQSETEREELREQNILFKSELEKAKTTLAQVQHQTQGQESVQAALQKAQAANQQYEQQIAAMEGELKRLRATVALDMARGARVSDAGQSAQSLNNMAPAAGYEPSPAPSIPPVAAIVPTAKPSAPAQPLFGEGDIKALLARANIGVQGGVRKVAPGIYGWKAGTLSGRAEVVADNAGFERLVDQHINKAKSQCNGDFAAIPSAQGAGAANFEVACVSGSGGVSSSIAFFEQKGSFIAISVDTAAENMDLAMDTRDRIAQVR